jgi:hypothetical protein
MQIDPRFLAGFLSLKASATALAWLDPAAQTPHAISFSFFAARGAK